jgi:putative ABC transport system ATP-binding protein
MQLFQALNEEGVTILLVTHEPEISRYTSRIVELRDGLVIHDAVGEKRSATADLASLKGQTGLTYLSETH